jgi:DGQHR domain-containing protein
MPTFRYDCLLSKQRTSADAPSFCIFHAPAGEILDWADIRRLNPDDPGAPQRQTSRAKVRAIKKFLDGDQRNTIPTSVVLTIDLGLEQIERLQIDGTHSFGTIKIEFADGAPKPGLVIDGQHRLYGMKEFGPDTEVNVVAILAANDMEKAFQFLVINNKASKVSMDHIRALSLHYEEEALNTRLETARLTLDPNVGYVGLVNNADDSPFYGQVDWPATPEANRLIVPASIEAAIGLIKDQKVRDFDNSNDVLLEFFYTIWRHIKQRWPTLWNGTSHLLDKVGVICMTKYMTDALVGSYDLGRLDISDPEDVGRLVDEVLAYQEPSFWTVPWIPSSYDTKAGRALIVSSLVQIARNLRAGEAWHEGLEIIDAANIQQ